tara:strand:- start:345 stop:530 length:186 start_codon:yes stop_codon:yes gene_type:complete
MWSHILIEPINHVHDFVLIGIWVQSCNWCPVFSSFDWFLLFVKFDVISGVFKTAALNELPT